MSLSTLDGWLILDKPEGPSSSAMVGAVKRALRENGYSKVRIGHTGTLDPLASGVLPIALGEATKLAGRLLAADKSYEFTIGFGVATDSDDAEGEVIATSDIRPSRADIEAVLARFTGDIVQVPPAFSALKIDGKRAYQRARAGETVKMAERSVRVHALRLEEAGEGPLESARFHARVSKGTYIRSLARDIAAALGTAGHVTRLRRLKAGPFGIEQAISLDNLHADAKARLLETSLLPLVDGLDDIPALSITSDQAGALRQGRRVIGIAAKPGLHLAVYRQVPVALVEVEPDGLRVVRGFNVTG